MAFSLNKANYSAFLFGVNSYIGPNIVPVCRAVEAGSGQV
jgi:hypothetical protein